MIREISFAEAWQMKERLFIDVRSENEFQQDHIPGAVNIPLLNNQEREKTGTIYKQESPKLARKYALAVVGPKLSGLIEQIEALREGKQLVLYCWRGGERSKALATVLDLMHLPVYRLLTGYKGYRSYVNQWWAQIFPFAVVVLHGLTGVGKTLILQHMQQNGLQVLDLEGLAKNRGSVFGSIGLEPQPSQKMFESLLWRQMQDFDVNQPIFVECESKRIGKLLVPDALRQGMRQGKRVLIYDTIANRAERILQDYQPESHQEAVIKAILCLQKKLGKETIDFLISQVKNGQYKAVIKVLFQKYYDPVYHYPAQPAAEYDISINGADGNLAAKEIAAYFIR